MMKSCAFAAFAAATTSSRDTSVTLPSSSTPPLLLPYAATHNNIDESHVRRNIRRHSHHDGYHTTPYATHVPILLKIVVPNRLDSCATRPITLRNELRRKLFVSLSSTKIRPDDGS